MTRMELCLLLTPRTESGWKSASGHWVSTEYGLWLHCYLFTDSHFHTEIIITNEDVEGLPILMLANKQDREDRLEVEDIKEIFNKIAERMSARDSRVLPISALSGYVWKNWNHLNEQTTNILSF